MKSTSSRWRFKGKLKLILVLLFLFSALFMSYQILYYTSLTNYQSLESHNKILSNNLLKEKDSKPEASAQSGSGVDSGKDGLSQFQLASAGGSPWKGGKPIFSGSILGVAPEYWILYTSQQQRNKKFFTCLTSHREISWSKLNDDFCDCPSDGSDEPSTAACMNGRFFCTTTVKSFPEYVPSSRVNDGICDCCDGSDEYDQSLAVTCKNHC